MVYAEGGVTNNSSIIKFKKGPFMAERTISPVFMKFDRPGYSLAYTMPIGPLVTLQYCCGFTVCKIKVMPDFQPNDYLFENFNDP